MIGARHSKSYFEGKCPPDLTRAWPSAYHLTRAWAQALYDTIPALEGIIYESHQVDGDCIVLFDTDGHGVFRDLASAQPISATPVREVLIREALKASAGMDIGTDDDAP